MRLFSLGTIPIQGVELYIKGQIFHKLEMCAQKYHFPIIISCIASCMHVGAIISSSC